MNKKEQKKIELWFLMDMIKEMIEHGEKTENGVWINDFLSNVFLGTVNKVIELYDLDKESI